MKQVKYKKYICGGFVRDQILGVKSKDIDYSIVIENKDDFDSPVEALYCFRNQIESEGYMFRTMNPRTFTIVATNPETGATDDFVLARKESGYRPETREPSKIGLGTLKEDAERRDFACNALFIDIETNEIIDFFGGLDDINNRLIRTPVSAEVSFTDDPLRILRAFRFSVTKNFKISQEVLDGISVFDVNRFKETISTERVREELFKMFKFNTNESMHKIFTLGKVNEDLYNYIFHDCGIWLKPTTEK